MSRLYLDEHKARGYIVVATEVADADVTSVRRDVMSLRMKGQSRIHFTKESDRRRRVILSELIRTGVRSHVYVSSAKHDEVARDECLSALIGDVSRLGVTHIVLERDDSIVKFDRRILFREIAAQGLGPSAIQYSHERSRDEPLLWISDAIAWSYGRGGEWRDRIDPLCTSIKVVP
ncbi:hypothetical protein [Aeromicrobium sp. 9AM]|uniref:hypothetical protein n=1 Tax=Aeromicrobium sp. 9AM TaxID=2653126 RepID=UPI0012F14495|nr:hypothetical protein [Aeromicrobium sp. 9AM]VXC49936.1 conserved hypothetical protein [Aeromicrobium sp. 9AM]